MQMLKEIKAVPSPYRGSENTAKMVREEIRRRWGDKAAQEYNPYFTTRTYRDWSRINYRVRRNQRAIKSIIVCEETDDKGNVINTYPKVINLFHINQVERLTH
jgi:hypothetical protein